MDSSNDIPIEPINAKQPDVGFKCPSCAKVYSNKHSQMDHYRRKHRNRPPLKCSEAECEGASFTTLQELKRHRSWKHDNERHQCQFCDAEYVQEQSLYKHNATKHGAPKVFTCATCTTAYEYQSSLQRHCRQKHPTTTTDS